MKRDLKIFLLILDLGLLILFSMWAVKSNFDFEPMACIIGSIAAFIKLLFYQSDDKKDLDGTLTRTVNKSEVNSSRINITGNNNKLTLDNTQKDTKPKINPAYYIVGGIIAFYVSTSNQSGYNKPKLNNYEALMSDYKDMKGIYSINPIEIDRTLKMMKDLEQYKKQNNSEIQKLMEMLEFVKLNKPIYDEYLRLSNGYFNAFESKNLIVADKIENEIHDLSDRVKSIKNINNSPTFDADKERLIYQLNNFEK